MKYCEIHPHEIMIDGEHCRDCVAQLKRQAALADELSAVINEYLEWGAFTSSDRYLFDEKFRAVLAKHEKAKAFCQTELERKTAMADELAKALRLALAFIPKASLSRDRVVEALAKWEEATKG